MSPPSSRLSDVLLANNPNPTGQTGWSRLSHRAYDLVTWDYGPGNWSVACNLQRIGPGSLGWIHRADGSFGHLAGFIVFDDVPRPTAEPGGTAHYCTGLLWRLPREWWIDGARVSLHCDWSGRAPFGPTRRFRNGEELRSNDRKVLFGMLHLVAQLWVTSKICEP